MHQNGDFDHQIDGKKSPTFFASTPIYDSSKVAHLGRALLSRSRTGIQAPAVSSPTAPAASLLAVAHLPLLPLPPPPLPAALPPSTPLPTLLLLIPSPQCSLRQPDCSSASNGVQLTNSHKPLKTSSPKIVINAHCQQLRGRLRRRSEQY